MILTFIYRNTDIYININKHLKKNEGKIQFITNLRKHKKNKNKNKSQIHTHTHTHLIDMKHDNEIYIYLFIYIFLRERNKYERRNKKKIQNKIQDLFKSVICEFCFRDIN